MDNKKWYSRFATCFWWTLTILPFVYLLMVFVACIVNYNSLGGTPVTASVISTCFSEAFESSCTTIGLFFRDFSIPSLTSGFERFFEILDINNIDFWAVVVGYMTTVQVVHLVFDVIVWLPHMAHGLMERVC